MKPYLNLTSAEFGPEQFKALVEAYEKLVEFQEKFESSKVIYARMSDTLRAGWQTRYEYFGKDISLQSRVRLEKRNEELQKDVSNQKHTVYKQDARIAEIEGEKLTAIGNTNAIRAKLWHKWLYLFYGSCLGAGILGLVKWLL